MEVIIANFEFNIEMNIKINYSEIHAMLITKSNKKYY